MRSSRRRGRVLESQRDGESALTAKKRRERPRLPQREVHTLEDLDQIRLLADPLRLRILEAFCEERTTKQVAGILGEKPTKLYHHVDALERVGLIALSRTRQNRGTMEKYFLAVARTFRVDSRAFQSKARGGSEESAAMRQMMTTLFDTTSAELAALADRGDATARAMADEALVSFLDIRASKAQLRATLGKLREIIRSLTADAEGAAESDDDPDQGRYRLTLAFFPLDEAGDGPRREG